MTVAPDLVTLFDLETAFESAAQQRVLQLGIDQVLTQQGSSDRTSGRVDVWLTVGTDRPNSCYVPANLDDCHDSRATYENAWNAILCLEVVTNRDKAEPGSHRKMVAKIRVLMAQFFNDEAFSALLPYHELVNVHSAGTTPGIKSDKNEDITQLRFACVIAIRDTAWPAPYA